MDNDTDTTAAFQIMRAIMTIIILDINDIAKAQRI